VNISLKRLFPGLRSGQAKILLPLSAVFFLTTFSFYIIKPVKENFLISVTPAWWPYADLITALLIGFVVVLNTRLLGVFSRRIYISAVNVFFVSNLAVFWFFFHMRQQTPAFSPVIDTSGFLSGLALADLAGRAWPFTVFLFSFWSDVFIAMSVTSFWMIVNDVFNPHEAKRTIGLLVSSGLAGGIIGSLLTSRLSLSIEPEDLLLVSAACVFLSVFVVNSVYAVKKTLPEADEEAVEQSGRPAGGYLDGFRIIKKDRYLRLITGMVAVSTIVAVTINYQFKTVVKDVYENGMERTSFLGSFFFLVLVLSAIFHLAATERVIKTFGLQAAMLMAPVVLAVGSAAVFIIPAAMFVSWNCGLRGAEKLFDTTSGQSVRELLYMPVLPEAKYRAKMTIDMFVNKLGTGIGAVLYLGVYHLSDFGLKTPAARARELAIIAGIFALTWIVLGTAVFREYPGLLKKSLSRKWADGRRLLAEKVDLEMTEEVFDLIDSRERSSALYAMNVFDLVRKRSLSPELLKLLDEKSAEIKARSLDGLFDVGGEIFYRGVGETLAESGMKAEIEEVFGLDVYKSVMERAIMDTAVSGTEVGKMEAARLLGFMETDGAVDKALSTLLGDSSPDVVHYALMSAAVHGRPEHIPAIIDLLASGSTARDAASALQAYGQAAEESLIDRVADETEKIEIRRNIPAILAEIGSSKAASALAVCLGSADGRLQMEALEALNRIRTSRPSVKLDSERIRAHLLAAIEKCYDFMLGSSEKETGSGDQARPEERPGPCELEMKRIFDLLALIYPHDDIVRAYHNLVQGSRKSMDYLLELLDNILEREMRSLLLPLIEDLPDEERIMLLKKNRRLLKGKKNSNR